MKVNLLKNYSVEYCLTLLTEINNSVSTDSYFCSLQWLSCWISSVSTLPLLAVFNENNSIVGVAFVGVKESTFGPVLWKSAFLNQNGVQTDDQVWIEYNKIFCLPGKQASCIEALLNLMNELDVSEFFVSLTNTGSLWANASRTSWHLEIDRVFAAKVDLCSISDETSYLSKNTRYQVTRANKQATKKYGNLTTRKAESPHDIANFFSVLSELHIKRWGDTEFGSGFHNTVFVAHLERLLQEHDNSAELIAVYAGETLIGVSLNLLADTKIGFYCSGINYDIADNKIKPGYILHSQVIKYYKSIGKTEYDFLAGYARYKKSLATDIYHLNTIRLTKRNLRGTIVYLLRNAKQLFLKLKQKTNG